jgi:hypothetical protein
MARSNLQQKLLNHIFTPELWVKLLPGAMKDLFEMANRGQQRQRRFNQHPFVVSIRTADFEIAGITLLRMKAYIRKDHVRSSYCSMNGLKWVS